ncbi:MAG: hypothetical protein O3A10_13305 [Chloroflexi bacterium]|nr:hypothetical protein [Chloroflexota bacterium]MDA1147662.1 hypothetical protein [Chloroflexota bacterium]
MRYRALWTLVCGAVALAMSGCGGSSVEFATPSGTASEGASGVAVPTIAEAAIGSTSDASPAGGSGAGCTSDAAPVFTHHYTDLDGIEFINPTIVTSGNWLKNRQYHKVVTDADNHAAEVPIYAPADAVATGVTYYLSQMVSWAGDSFELAQYDIRFRVSCEVTFGFDHVSRLEEPFASLAPAAAVRDTRDAEVRLSVEVEAGQLIGWTTGTEPAHVWDFSVSNTAVTNVFANQARYEGTGDLARLLHAVCPSDYLAPGLVNAYRAKFGWWQGSAADAGCRSPADVAGALAGGWFQAPFEPVANAAADWGLVATVAADGYLDVSGPGVSLRVAPEDPSFLDPAAMTGEHCYVDYQRRGWAYVALTSGVTLAAAFGEGACPSALPDTHQVFYR